MAINPAVAALQIPEGFTTRKVKGVLKIVPAKARKVAIVEERKPQMPKQISVSIYPFGSYREQLWIGKVVDGEFVKESPLYKEVQAGKITAKKSYDGKFGKPSTSEDWEIIVPDNFSYAIAKSRLSDASLTGKRQAEYKVL